MKQPSFHFSDPDTNLYPAFYENLQTEMGWLSACLSARVNAPAAQDFQVNMPKAPTLKPEGSLYAEFVEQKKLSEMERLVLALLLAPYLSPNIFNTFHNVPIIAQYAKLIQSTSQTSLLPSGETALFLLAGTDIEHRLNAGELLTVNHLFYQENIIEMASVPNGEPEYLGLLSLTPRYRERFVHNREIRPRFSEEFPADLITTSLEWEDLVLSRTTERKLNELKDFLSHYQNMVAEWKMDKHARPGCRILFHGDSGTGKTLVATLLGKYLKKMVFRVDISLVTSKYVGETSRRLRSLFNTAESKGWILFFDEGDALLGQRKNTTDTLTNQYANQDTAFLLQRIEKYDGIVVVATNFQANIDRAFTRRFEHVVKFSPLEHDQLKLLWQQTLPVGVEMEPSVNLEHILNQYPCSPADLVSIVHRACLMTYSKSTKQISHNDILTCFKDIELRYKGMSMIK